MTENEIIRGLIVRDEAAFRELVEQYKGLVVNVSNHFLRNDEDALDISQEVFIEVFRSIEKFRQESKLSTWLYRIAVNRSLNHLRSRKKSVWKISLDELLFSPENSRELITGGTRPDQAIEEKEDEAIVNKALAILPFAQRTAFSLFQYEDMAYKDIAEIMHTNTSHVGVLITRARKKMQDFILDYYKKH